MLAWMFNRHKGKAAEPTSDPAAETPDERVKRLHQMVKDVAPDALTQDAESWRRHIAGGGREPSRGAGDAWSQLDDILGDDDGAEETTLGGGYDDGGLEAEPRQDIAMRLRRHLPDLPPSERLEMIDELVAAIDRMAAAYLPQIRDIITRELSFSPYLTRQASGRLNQEVAAFDRVQVLDYIELLNDADFLDILRGRGHFVRVAAAQRQHAAAAPMPEMRREPPAPGLLARLRGEGRKDDDKVVPLPPRATTPTPAKPLEKLLSGQDRLSLRARRRVAHFVAAFIFDTLVEQRRLRAEVARALRQAVRQRIERSKFDGVSGPGPALPPIFPAEPEAASPSETVMSADAPMSADEAILEALARDEDVMVIQGLAHLAQLPEDMVAKILESGSARAICALAWRAGMGPSAAVVLQMGTGRVPEAHVIHPTDSGRYALPAEEMRWYLAFFNDLAPGGAPRPPLPR